MDRVEPVLDRQRLAYGPHSVSEDSLKGGITNAGKVVRVGPHVLRP